MRASGARGEWAAEGGQQCTARLPPAQPPPRLSTTPHPNLSSPGIADVDTRAITLRLRDTGCLNAVITRNAKLSDSELVERARGWSIVGKDLISEVGGREEVEGGRRVVGRPGWPG